MKRITALLLVIISALPLLTACVPEEWTAEESTAPTPIPTVTENEPTVWETLPSDYVFTERDPLWDFTFFAPGDYLTSPKFDTDEYLPDCDADNAFITHGNSDNGGVCSADGRVYYMYQITPREGKPRTYLMYRDMTTGETAPLCAREDCAHDDTKCWAYAASSADDIYGMYLYDGMIYWCTMSSVFRIGLDGTGQQKIVNVPGGMFREYDLDSICTAVPHRGYVYYAGKSRAERYTGGSRVWKYTLTIGAEPLDGGDDGEVIFEREVSSFSPCQLRFAGNYVYIMIADHDDISDSDSSVTVEFYRWDAKTRTAEALFTYPYQLDVNGEEAFLDLYRGFTLLDDGMYFGAGIYRRGEHYSIVSQSEGIYKYSFESGEVEPVVWLDDVNIIYYTADRIYTTTTTASDCVLQVYDCDGELISPSDTGIPQPELGMLGSAFAGADEDYLYFTKPGSGYLAVPLDLSENITLGNGE